jgi:hypothetical protein
MMFLDYSGWMIRAPKLIEANARTLHLIGLGKGNSLKNMLNFNHGWQVKQTATTQLGCCKPTDFDL